MGENALEPHTEPAGEKAEMAKGASNRVKKPQRRISGKAFGMSLAASLILLLGSGGYLAWSYQNYAEQFDRAVTVKEILDAEIEADAVIAAQEKAAKAAISAAAMIAKAAEVEASNMALEGYSAAGNGLNYRFAEDSEFTCGNYDCTVVVVTTGSKTCSGVYLEANLIRNGTVVGFVNDTAGYLGKYSVAVLTLEDYQSTGGDFQITKVSCY